MVDAAGAIYVIGGTNGFTTFQDVWASTDGGTRAGLRQKRELRGVLRGHYRVLMVLQGYYRGTKSNSVRTAGGNKGTTGGTYSGGTQG